MVTHRDIAQEVGVSQATVSKVLSAKSGSISISVKTRQAVIDAAQRLGYNREKVASGLIQLAEKSIAVVVEHISQPFCSVLMNGVEQALLESPYKFFFVSTSGKPDQSMEAIKSLCLRYTTGFVLLPFHLSTASRQIRSYLQQCGVPFVQTCYYNYPGPNTAPIVTTNNYQVFSELTQHLIQLGHKRIALVYSCPEYSCTQERICGYTDTMQQAGLEVDPDLLVNIDREDYFDVQLKKELLQRWLKSPARPTAIMTLKDDCALQFMMLLENLGLEVPDDMAVTGFDDYWHFIPNLITGKYHDLTTVRQNLPEIGRQAVNLLLQLLNSEGADWSKEKPPQVVVPAELVVRGSCGSQPTEPPVWEDQLRVIDCCQQTYSAF